MMEIKMIYDDERGEYGEEIISVKVSVCEDG